jgi:hypothetical protein
MPFCCEVRLAECVRCGERENKNGSKKIEKKEGRGEAREVYICAE